MHVNPPQTASHQAMTLDERVHLRIRCRWDGREFSEKAENRIPFTEVSARQLADHKGMAADFARFEQPSKGRVVSAEVIHPDGGIYENQRDRAGARRRRIGRRSRSLPPSAASLRALSRAINASSPAWTTAVFSGMPVSLRASASSRSSIFSVVFICTNMAIRTISHNIGGRALLVACARRGLTARRCRWSDRP